MLVGGRWRRARSACARQGLKRSRRPSSSRWLCWLAPTFAGHAFGPWDGRPISIAADLVHVAAAAFWTGGLSSLPCCCAAGQASAR